MKPRLIASRTRRVGVAISSSGWTLLAALVVSELVYIALVRFRAINSSESVLMFLAMMGVLFGAYGGAYAVCCRLNAKSAMRLIVVGAVVFRVTLLFVGLGHHDTWKRTALALRADVQGEAVTYDNYLLFDNDVWRYLWDGHVSSHGISPYRYEPRSPALDQIARLDPSGVWTDIRANVNYPDVPTIYPPGAQLIFRMLHAVAPGSVFGLKLFLTACDLVTVWLVATMLRQWNQPVASVVLYAWNPLVIKAVAGSAHIDGVAALLLMATLYFAVRRWRSAAAIGWALSVLVKTSPVVLAPFLIRRLGWRRIALGLAIIAAAYAPYLDRNASVIAGLRIFADQWQFNSGFFSLGEWLASYGHGDPVHVTKIAAVVLFTAVMAWLCYRDRGEIDTLPRYALPALGAMLLLGPTVMPWYVVWLVPLAVVARSRAWLYFSGLVCLAFLVMIDGSERAWALWIEYGTMAMLLGREYLRAKPHPAAQAPEGENWPCNERVITAGEAI